VDNNKRPDDRLNTRASSEFNERRKKSDWIIKMTTVLSALSWIVAFIVWIVLDRAVPEKENMFTSMFNVAVRDYWESSLLPIALALLIVSLCLSIFAFVFNMLRMRRKTDKYRKSVIIIGVITIIGIVFYIIRFGI